MVDKMKWIFVLIPIAMIVSKSNCGIIPPPWSDPSINPCANLPGGWQLLYWSPLKQCFKIFTIGYPCPDTMELSPSIVANNRIRRTHNVTIETPAAECRCPPGTAINLSTEKCHRIFERGPCDSGEYFSPLSETIGEQIQLRGTKEIRQSNNRLGSCRVPRKCPDNMLYWPKDNKCYVQFTKGPCEKGNLLVFNQDSGLGECKCENIGPLGEYFYAVDKTCHEHFTQGPCSSSGHIFLPGGECGCNNNLPHYHQENHMCYELNTVGPCARGHMFTMVSDNDDSSMSRARCQCKEDYVPWTDGNCYRLYTRGPCEQNEFLINATTCIRNFCGKNRLYFPKEKTCYRIGTQGPCAMHQVVVFDFMAKPSIDGISFNGVCGCSGVITNLNQQCLQLDDPNLIHTLDHTNQCESQRDAVEFNGQCFKLYSRGPCGQGQWLEPIKAVSNTIQSQLISHKRAKCVCRPGYKPPEGTNQNSCNAPTVELAKYLTINEHNVLF